MIEQIQVLSTVVQEMITLPSISPTASAADMQHWLISPLEMRQWTEMLIALNESNNFSSFDKATKSAVRDGLGRFISFIGINARSKPDAELLLLDLYVSITVLPAPELESCFLGINKSKLLRRLGQRMQNSLTSTSPSVSPDEVKLFGQLAAEGLSAREIPQPQELRDRTDDALTILEQAARLGETQPAFAVATAEALAALLEMRVPNQEFRTGTAVIRLRAVNDLIHTAWTSVVIHQRDVPDRVLTVIGRDIPDLLSWKSNLYPQERFTAAWRYVQVLDTVVELNSNKKEIVESLASTFDGYHDIDTNNEIMIQLGDLLRNRLR